MRLLHKAARLTAEERRLVLEGACLSLAAALGVRILTPARLVRRWTRPRDTGPARLTVSPERAAGLVAFGASLVPSSTCLTRALALARVLARRGVDARVVIGGRRAASGLEAHAWVTSGERVILGGATRDGYTELVRFGAPASEVAA